MTQPRSTAEMIRSLRKDQFTTNNGGSNHNIHPKTNNAPQIFISDYANNYDQLKVSPNYAKSSPLKHNIHPKTNNAPQIFISDYANNYDQLKVSPNYAKSSPLKHAPNYANGNHLQGYNFSNNETTDPNDGVSLTRKQQYRQQRELRRLKVKEKKKDYAKHQQSSEGGSFCCCFGDNEQSEDAEYDSRPYVPPPSPTHKMSLLTVPNEHGQRQRTNNTKEYPYVRNNDKMDEDDWDVTSSANSSFCCCFGNQEQPNYQKHDRNKRAHPTRVQPLKTNDEYHNSPSRNIPLYQREVVANRATGPHNGSNNNAGPGPTHQYENPTAQRFFEEQAEKQRRLEAKEKRQFRQNEEKQREENKLKQIDGILQNRDG